MVAETLTGARAQRIFSPQGHGWGSQLVPVWGSYAVAANVEDGDIFEMCQTPDRFLALGGQFTAADLDTGTEAMVLDVGWAANGAVETDSLKSPWGTVYNNAGYQADPDGLLDGDVMTGDAIAGIKPGVHLYYPFVLPLPLYFAKKTMIQVEANVAANAFTAGGMTVQLWGLIL